MDEARDRKSTAKRRSIPRSQPARSDSADEGPDTTSREDRREFGFLAEVLGKEDALSALNKMLDYHRDVLLAGCFGDENTERLRKELDEAAAPLREKWKEILFDPNQGYFFIWGQDAHVDNRLFPLSPRVDESFVWSRPGANINPLVPPLLENDDWEGIEGIRLAMHLVLQTFVDGLSREFPDAYSRLKSKLKKIRTKERKEGRRR